VVFGKYTGTEIEVDGTVYVCMLEEDLFGILRTDE
jgi:co-chaperonin GroES (HSP10)